MAPAGLSVRGWWGVRDESVPPIGVRLVPEVLRYRRGNPVLTDLRVDWSANIVTGGAAA